LCPYIIAWAAKAPLIPIHEALRASIWVAMVLKLSQWLIFKIQRAIGSRWVSGDVSPP